MENFIQFIPGILTGLAVAIPVVVQLVKYVKELVREKNWYRLVKAVLRLMIAAEEQFEKGSVKKDYVLVMAKTAAAEIGIEFDEEKIGEMIDALAAMSKSVNVTKEVAA